MEGFGIGHASSSDGQVLFSAGDRSERDADAAASAPPVEKTVVMDAAPLPSGWGARNTGDGRTFFIDHDTQQTTWDDPSFYMFF